MREPTTLRLPVGDDQVVIDRADLAELMFVAEHPRIVAPHRRHLAVAQARIALSTIVTTPPRSA